MAWWIYVAIAVSAVLVLYLIYKFLKSKSQNKKKKEKPIKKVAPIAVKEEKIEELVDDGLIYDEVTPSENLEIKNKNVKVEDYNPFVQNEDFSYDDALNDFEEKKYREFMERHSLGKKRKSSKLGGREEDDFEKFRNEHCYSKFLTDKQLLEMVTNLPEDVKSVAFSDTFKKIDTDKLDIKL